MCNAWCVEFVRNVSPSWAGLEDVAILEVGSLNVNGSPRDAIGNNYGSYVGVDLTDGPGVDQVLDVSNLVETFGTESFDVVISTEMLEHVKDWRLALVQMASVLKIGGDLVITTRSPGFEYHPYPLDEWRFTRTDMEKIFVPPVVWTVIEDDPDLRHGKPSGVGVLARKVGLDMDAWACTLRAIQVAKP